MAIVTFDRAEAEGGGLPLICLRCGRFAPDTVRIVQGGVYNWKFKFPFCEAHRNHYSWRTLATACAWLILLIPLIAFGINLVRDMPGKATLEDGLRLIIDGLFMVLYLCVLVYLPLLLIPGVRLIYNRRRRITFAGVSREFVHALKDQRHVLNVVALEQFDPTKRPPQSVRDLMDGRLALQEDAVRALELAAKQAHSLNHAYVGSLHLLFGLAALGPAVSTIILRDCGIAEDAVAAALRNGRVVSPSPDAAEMPITPIVRNVFWAAAGRALYFHDGGIDSEDLLQALLQTRDGMNPSDAMVFFGKQGSAGAAILGRLRESRTDSRR
jgi:hypothetical protein